MPHLLRKLLDQNGLLKIDAIENIDKSCCNSKALVIDFDYAKDCFITKLAVPPLKSVDCLYLAEEKNILLFIEMKDVNKLITYQKSKFPTLEEFTEFLEKSFDDFSLKDKITDSHALLLSMMGYYNMDSSFYGYYLDKQKLKIRFILLVDVSSRDFVTYNIANLANVNKYKFRFLDRISLVRAEDFDDLMGEL